MIRVTTKDEIDALIEKERKSKMQQTVYVTIPILVVHKKGLTKRGLLRLIRQNLPVGGTGGSDFDAHVPVSKPWSFAKEPKLGPTPQPTLSRKTWLKRLKKGSQLLVEAPHKFTGKPIAKLCEVVEVANGVIKVECRIDGYNVGFYRRHDGSGIEDKGMTRNAHEEVLKPVRK